jgi:hypothetical protein
MMPAKFSQKALCKSSQPLIDPGFNLSNHWRGMFSRAMGKNNALISSSSPASSIDCEYILSHYFGSVFPSYLEWFDGLNLWGKRIEASHLEKHGNLSCVLTSLCSDSALLANCYLFLEWIEVVSGEMSCSLLLLDVWFGCSNYCLSFFLDFGSRLALISRKRTLFDFARLVHVTLSWRET